MANNNNRSSPAKPYQAIIMILLPLLSLICCAKEGMPPGGPVDTTPPQVVSVSPKPDSTNVDLSSKIRIVFSERMSGESTQEAVFVSPFPKTPLGYNWNGKVLTLSPSEPLQKDKTYVITIGTGTQDLRRNRMSRSFTFSFSTGSSIDQGMISGEVWVRQPVGLGKDTGISIWAYLLSPERTVVYPQKEKPDYVTQPDSGGKYVFKNLSWGKFRLFAVKDVNRDMLWSGEDEIIGVTTGDVELTETQPSRTFVDFILYRVDQGPPSLLNCRALNRNSVRLEFNEALDDKTISDTTGYSILSVPDQKPLKVTEAFYQDFETKTVYLQTDEMSSNATYDLKTSGLKDLAGNLIDTAYNNCRFEGSGISDTIGLRILSILPKDGSANAPIDTKIKLVFNQPPEPQMVETNLSVTDSNGVRLTGKGIWTNPATFVLSLDSILSGKSRYTVNLLGKGMRNLSGYAQMKDSMVTCSFVTINPDTFGTVSGRMVIINEGGKQESTILTLWQPKENGWFYQTTAFTLNRFRFERILPGKYFLGGYIDLNHNQTFDLGQVNPYSPMEPFAVYPETIYVRSRWETEGVELKFH